jgi:hypothetical protein
MSEGKLLDLHEFTGVVGASLPFVRLPAFVARRDEVAAEPLVGRPERSLLPRGGLAVVGGVGGSGKTTFTIDAVAHFASATTWHELELGRALRVAMIDVEGPREPLRQKLEHKLAVWEGEPFAENVLVLDGEPWGDFSFAQPDHRRRLRQSCSELEIDLVVCNPLGRLGMPGGGTPEEVGTFVGWLRDCGMWQDIAFWLIHHFNRGAHRDVLLRLSGAWDRDADTIIGLAREGERKTKLTWAKFRWALDGGPAESNEVLEWDVPTLSFRSVPRAEALTVSPEEVKQRVLEQLGTDDEWRTSTWVRQAARSKHEAVDQALRDLFEAGSIRLSVARPGNEVETVTPEQWGDWGRLRTAKYWKASSQAGQQSPLPLGATAADTSTPPRQEEGSRPVASLPVGGGDGRATTHRGHHEEDCTPALSREMGEVGRDAAHPSEVPA